MTDGHKIITQYIRPPVPSKNYDWTAYLDGQEEEGPYGYGETEKDAIMDLMAELAPSGEE